MLSSRSIGYICVVITMLIWGGFTITARLNTLWHIGSWDIVALRFGLAFCILVPILIYQKDTAFLWRKEPFILAMFGGIGYCLSVYSGFYFAPTAHAAIFLSGFLPLCTAVAAYALLHEPFTKDTWLSVVIMLTAIISMSYLMYQSTGVAFGVGDLLFFSGALCWGIFSVLLKQWKLTAWHTMAGVVIWSTLIYLPTYMLFLPHNIDQAQPIHLIMQTLFHGIFVVILATLTYVEAVKRLGAFKAGSIATLAPFIAAVIAVPLLNEPLSPAVACGLIGMVIGALQPWRWIGRRDSLEKALYKQNKQSQSKNPPQS